RVAAPSKAKVQTAVVSSAPISSSALLRLRFAIQIVAHHKSALHDELYALHLADIRKRISRNRDDICEFTFLDASNFTIPTVVQHVGCRQICGLQRLRHCHSPFGIECELIRL